jgi:hypothetical protein
VADVAWDLYSGQVRERPLNIGLVAFALGVGLALTISYLILWNITRQIHTSAPWWFLLTAEAAAIAGDISTIGAPEPDRFVSVFTGIDVYVTHGLLPVVVIVRLFLRPSRHWFRRGSQPGGLADLRRGSSVIQWSAPVRLSGATGSGASSTSTSGPQREPRLKG